MTTKFLCDEGHWYSPIYLPTRPIFAGVSFFLTVSPLCSPLLISPNNLLISQWRKSNRCFSAYVQDIQTARLQCCRTSQPNPAAELSVFKRPFLLCVTRSCAHKIAPLRWVWKWIKQVSRRGNSLKMGDFLPPFRWVQACIILSRLFLSWRSTWQWWLLNKHTLSHNINGKVSTPENLSFSQPNAGRHALQQSSMWHQRKARPRGKGMVVGSVKQWTLTQETTVSFKIPTTCQHGVFHVYNCIHDDKGPLALMKKSFQPKPQCFCNPNWEIFQPIRIFP